MDVYTALAVYENLKNQGYDVFFDYRSISSGDFEQIITANIKACAHFLLILTPTALDRCNEPGDWLRREIEIAIEEKRNIIPLFFKGFKFGVPSVSDKLTGKLKSLSRYNGLNVHEDYFDEAMQRVRTQFLSVPLDTVLHPVSTEVQKAVKAEQVAADRALEKLEDVKELAKQAEEKPAQPKPAPIPDPKEAELDGLKKQAIQYELRGKFWDALQIYYQIKRLDPLFPSVDVKIRQLEKETRPISASPPIMASQTPVKSAVSNIPVSSRWIAIGIAAMLVIALCIWGGSTLYNNIIDRPATNTPMLFSSPSPEPIGIISQFATQTALAQPIATTQMTMATVEAFATQTALTQLTAIPTLGIGSTMAGNDGMTLLYVPAGEFTMGSDTGGSNEKPIHTVYLDAFWIDKTEVTNLTYAICVDSLICIPPRGSTSSSTYYGNPSYYYYPVIYVDWNMAKTYCEWAGRRLPTEAEWEKAARGTDGRTYPWGNDAPNNNLLNYNNAVGGTTKVGKYSDGKSIYGTYDMAGNVLEWVSSLYQPYPYSASDGREDLNASGGRVLRGGSWDYIDDFVRSYYRSWLVPSYANNIVGFRCAMDATP